MTVFEPIPPEDTATRNLVVLLVDASGSMTEPGVTPGLRKIDELNQALAHFVDKEMHQVEDLQMNGEIAIGAFSGTDVDWLDLGPPVVHESPFRFVRYVTTVPTISANGHTPIGRAIERALDEIKRRKKDLQDGGLEHQYRPNIFLLTDGKPSYSIDEARRRLHADEDAKRVLFYALGTGDADEKTLITIANKLNYQAMGTRPIAWFLKFVSKSFEHQAGRSTSDRAEDFYADVHQTISQSDEADRLLDEH